MKNQEEVTPTEARQATMRPRAMVWVLFGSLFLCLMAGSASLWVGLVSRCRVKRAHTGKPKTFTPL